jgi:hypothetical protein
MWQYVVEPTTTLGNFVIHIGTHESDGMQIHTLSPSTAVNSPRIPRWCMKECLRELLCTEVCQGIPRFLRLAVHEPVREVVADSFWRREGHQDMGLVRHSQKINVEVIISYCHICTTEL